VGQGEWLKKGDWGKHDAWHPAESLAWLKVEYIWSEIETLEEENMKD